MSCTPPSSSTWKALTTTAAGLTVAIPSMVAYFYLKGRVERFAARSESIYRELDDTLAGARA